MIDDSRSQRTNNIPLTRRCMALMMNISATLQNNALNFMSFQLDDAAFADTKALATRIQSARRQVSFFARRPILLGLVWKNIQSRLSQ